MAKFGKRSLLLLSTCVPEIQVVMNTAILVVDFTILSGRRGESEQNDLFRRGLSKKMWPNSKHNVSPLSEGIDIAPFPVDWKDTEKFYFLGGVVLTVAYMKGIELRWGGDWDRDLDLHDQTFMDLGHFETVK